VKNEGVNEMNRYRFAARVAAAILAAALFVAPARADHAGDQGVGVMLGNPTGLSYKIFLDDQIGIDAAFGVDQGDLDTHVTLLIHDWNLMRRSPNFADITRNGDLPVYFGIGPRLLFADDDTEVGLRLPLGASYFPHGTPWETFIELAPVIRLAPSTGLDLDFSLGVRYYFPAIRPRSR
jgi:hypothetical protein